MLTECYTILLYPLCVVVGDDYNFLDTLVTFPPAAGPTEMASLQVEIVDDMAVEGDHGFTVGIDAVEPSMVTVGTPNFVPVTIVDDDGNGMSYFSVMIIFLQYSVHSCIMQLIKPLLR